MKCPQSPEDTLSLIVDSKERHILSAAWAAGQDSGWNLGWKEMMRVGEMCTAGKSGDQTVSPPLIEKEGWQHPELAGSLLAEQSEKRQKEPGGEEFPRHGSSNPSHCSPTFSAHM